MLRNLIGSRAFYRHLFMLMMPIMIQNGITNFVNMLDNIMIGAVGTAQMTGVSLTNQLMFVFNLCIFGAVSGAGIFGTQFYGKGDYEGVRATLRFKLLFCTLIGVLGITLFIFLGEPILKLYMQGEQGVTSAADTLHFAKEYMSIMMVGLLPFAAVQCYSGTLRESANPTLPMIAGVIAVLVNLIGNYLLIFGRLGLPAMGVNGAALATVISRFVELAIVIIGSHCNPARYPFLKGLYHSMHVPGKLVGQLIAKGLPLMANETFWAVGIAIVNQCYSVRGLDSMAALNISQTFYNVFSIAYIAVGSSVGIILGQMLGADRLDEAKPAAYQLITFSFLISVAVGLVYAVLAEFIPLAYNTEPSIRLLATRLMQITALMMPFDAVTHSSYFALRSGGRMLITFLFDCGFVWIISVPLALALSHFTTLPFVWLYAIVQFSGIIKTLLGFMLVHGGSWVRNITNH